MYIRVIWYRACNNSEYVLLRRDEFEVDKFNFEVNDIIDSFKREGCEVKIKVNRSIDGYYIYVTIGNIYCDSIYDGLMRLGENIFMSSVHEKFLSYILNED